MPEETLLLVGLGNPGEKYKNNRHNVGFMVLDYVTNQLKFGRSRTKFLEEPQWVHMKISNLYHLNLKPL